MSCFKYRPNTQKITKLSKRQQQKSIQFPQKILNYAKIYNPTSLWMFMPLDGHVVIHDNVYSSVVLNCIIYAK